MNNLNQKSKKELIEIIENLTKNNKNESAVNKINIKNILASMIDFVFIFDKEQRFTFVNIPESQRLYTKPDAFLGKKHHEVMPVAMHQKFEQAFEKNKQGKFAEYKYELELNNKLQYFSARLSPIFKNNTFQGSVAVVSDISKEKKTEKELNAQHTKIQSIFRSAPIGIGVVQNRIITQVNERFCEICGYSSGELINQSAEMVYPTKEEYEFVGQEKYKQIQKHGRGIVETKFKRKDGKIIDILLSSSSFNPDDLNAGVTFTALDITELKSIHRELKISEEKFRSFFDNSQAIMLEIDPETKKIVNCNKKAIEFYGYTEDQLLNKKIYEINTLEKNKINERMRIALQQTSFFSGFKHKLADNTYRDVNVYTSTVKIRNKKHIFIQVVDITESLKNEKKLKESEKKFRNTLENIDLIGLTIDRDANIIFANDYLLERTGWKSEEVIGKNWFDYFIPDELTSEIKKTFKKTFEKGEFPLHNINSVKTKSGKLITINWSNTVHYDSEHNPIAVTSIGEDITENLKNEEELEKYRNNLEQLVKERTEELETMNEELSEANKKLEEFNQLFIGREFRIKELRNKIKKYEENK